MTTSQVNLPVNTVDTVGVNSTRSRVRTWALVALAIVAVAVVAWNASDTPSARIANPAGIGAPSPVAPLLGFHHWLAIIQIFSAIAPIALIVVFVVAWRRFPAHPYLLMALVTTLIVWQDPIMNWAPFAVYNPLLWHFDTSWALVSASPSVEPFLVFGYVMFQLGPALLGIWILRKIQARRSTTSFVWRHPLVTLGVLILVVGFIIDAILENSLVHTGMYIYSQVIPFGSIFVGTTHQFPLLWESTGVTLVMIPAGILIYRDDTGRTVADKLAQRLRGFKKRPALGAFLVMFVIVNVAYLTYGAGFLAAKMSHAATSVACPWPYPEIKVYDPQGFYERNGQKGPYSVGIMSTWMSGEPNGRPNVQLPPNGGRCSSGSKK